MYYTFLLNMTGCKIFEPTCAHARLAPMRRLLSVYLSICDSKITDYALLEYMYQYYYTDLYCYYGSYGSYMHIFES